MATEPDRQALERIAEWARAESGITLESDGSLTVAGDPPLRIEVTVDDERILLTHHHTEATSDPGRTATVKSRLPARGLLVKGEVTSDQVSLMATLTATLYIDGMTRHGFVSGVDALVAAVDGIRQGAPVDVDAPTVLGAVPVAPEAATPGPITTEIARNEFESDEEPAAPARVTAEQPVVGDATPTMELSAVWVPTHRVPTGGMTAWPKPDGSLEPSAKLEPRVELTVAERRADWARVVGSNGWTGWVDARRLEEMSVPAAARGKRASGIGLVVAVAGAVGVIAAAFLPWFEVPNFSANSFDVALAFLWDQSASGEPALGYLIAGTGALGLISLFAASSTPVADVVRRVMGVVALIASLAFVYQVWQGFDASFGDVVDALGTGVFVAIPSALLLAVTKA